MELIVTLTFLTFVISFIHILTKPIIAYFSRPSKEENLLQKEVKLLRNQLINLSIRDNYIEHVKIERKIVSIETKIREISSINTTKNLILKYGISYGSQAFLTFILVIISIFWRSSPVIIFDNNFNFTPFSSIMKFPTDINNSISVPFWIFVSTLVSRTIVSFIKL